MKSWSPAALGVLSAAVLLRVVALWLTWDVPLAGDARSYHEATTQLLSAAPLQPEWPPGLPLMLLPFYAVLGPRPEIGRVVALAAFVVFGVVLHELARRLGGERRAVAALALFAVYPSFVWYSIEPLTQLPTAALVGAALLAGWAMAEDPSWRRGLVLGALLAGLLLLRPSNVILCLLGPVLLAFARRRAVIALAPVLVVAAAALAVGAWLHAETGRTVFINDANSRNFFYGNNEWTPPYKTWWFGSHKRGEPGVPEAYVRRLDSLRAVPAVARDRAFMRAALADIESEPGMFVVRTLARVRTMFAFDVFAAAQARGAGWPRLTALCLIGDAACWTIILAGGAVGLLTSKARLWSWSTAVVIALYSAPYFVSFSHPTYHAGLAAILAAWAPIPDLPSRATLGARGPLVTIALAIVAALQVEWVIRMASP